MSLASASNFIVFVTFGFPPTFALRIVSCDDRPALLGCADRGTDAGLASRMAHVREVYFVATDCSADFLPLGNFRNNWTEPVVLCAARAVPDACVSQSFFVHARAPERRSSVPAVVERRALRIQTTDQLLQLLNYPE